MPGQKKVAIIGGGIGGLAAAHYLHGSQSPGGDVFSCEVFESSGRIGGNGLSAYFEAAYEKPFADLGVNDFNLTAYKHMATLLQDMKQAGYEVPTGALTDTDCFFTFPGQPGPDVVFTSQDLDNPTTPLAKDIVAGMQKLEGLALKVMTDPVYLPMTVGEFLRAEEFPEDFGTYYFLPRINGMYFMGSVVPAEMPIRGVMNYYVLQEGIGSGTPDRRYFALGCSDWFRQLTAFLESRGVVIHLNSEAVVRAGAGLPVVQVNGARAQEWDEVVVAVPADQVAAVVQDGLPPLMNKVLNEFRYYEATAVAHTYAGVMPSDPGTWRTYNIRIFPPDSSPQAYTISYVETMHQGAPNAHPPTWFVSENPPVPVPDAEVCRMVDMEHGGYVPARTSFRHNTVTFGTIAAQAALPGHQGGNSLWYTGGWTNGAGLHEQILAQASDVATKMLGHAPVDEPIHTYSDQHPEHVPQYLRSVLVRQ